MAANEYLEKDGPAPTSGDLLKQLTAEAIAREEITNVVLTHAHPDHIGGILDTSGKPSFPNAQYASKTEWDFWTSNLDLKQPEPNNHVKEACHLCAEEPASAQRSHRIV